MTPRDETTIEVEQMFAELEGRSVEGDGDADGSTTESHWQYDPDSGRTDWQDSENTLRKNLKRKVNRPHGGARPGAGRPKKVE
jgi:hypothetical protein